jgi:hypothetical protein
MKIASYTVQSTSHSTQRQNLLDQSVERRQGTDYAQSEAQDAPPRPASGSRLAQRNGLLLAQRQRRVLL